jgi:hypothetical protein
VVPLPAEMGPWSQFTTTIPPGGMRTFLQTQMTMPEFRTGAGILLRPCAPGVGPVWAVSCGMKSGFSAASSVVTHQNSRPVLHGERRCKAASTCSAVDVVDSTMADRVARAAAQHSDHPSRERGQERPFVSCAGRSFKQATPRAPPSRMSRERARVRRRVTSVCTRRDMFCNPSTTTTPCRLAVSTPRRKYETVQLSTPSSSLRLVAVAALSTSQWTVSSASRRR